MTGSYPNRDRQGMPPKGQFDHLSVCELSALRQSRTDECGVIPGEFGDGFGQFLQPTVVGEASVEDVRVWTKIYFEVLGDGGRRGQLERAQFDFLRGQRGVSNQAVVKGLPPSLFEIG